MSFRLFIYYCAVLGGCAAFVGWGLGRLADIEHHILDQAVKALYLGMMVALALGLLDALWNGRAGRIGGLLQCVAVAVLVGSLGGFVGGLLGQELYAATGLTFFYLTGWIITGALVGAAPGVFDYLRSILANENSGGPRRKVLRGVLGGAVGGLLGAVLSLLLEGAGKNVLGKTEGFWMPSATGFVALGLCIGLLIGLAQVILKEAWLKVEAGFRPGRELILSKAEVTIGRGEGNDLGLYGDPGVDKSHARIVQDGDDWLLVDYSTGGATYLNGQPIVGPTALRSGDEIRMGRSVLRFNERRKHVVAPELRSQ
jgi:hypothetical protein